MPELEKIESVSNFTPGDGEVVAFYTEEGGMVEILPETTGMLTEEDNDGILLPVIDVVAGTTYGILSIPSTHKQIPSPG
jgi:hypothetical protein